MYSVGGVVWQRKGESTKDKKKSKKKSKKSGSSGQSAHCSGTSDNAVGSKSKSFCDLPDWEARDVACVVCGVKDSSPCTIFKGKKRLWAYAPKKDKKTGKWTTSGKACFICVRVQNAWYYPEIKISEMKGKLGADAELMQEPVLF